MRETRYWRTPDEYRQLYYIIWRRNYEKLTSDDRRFRLLTEIERRIESDPNLVDKETRDRIYSTAFTWMQELRTPANRRNRLKILRRNWPPTRATRKRTRVKVLAAAS